MFFRVFLVMIHNCTKNMLMLLQFFYCQRGKIKITNDLFLKPLTQIVQLVCFIPESEMKRLMAVSCLWSSSQFIHLVALWSNGSPFCLSRTCKWVMQWRMLPRLYTILLLNSTVQSHACMHVQKQRQQTRRRATELACTQCRFQTF